MDFLEVIESIVKSCKIFHSILENNEAQTRWMLIDPFILDGLGYSREDIIVEYNLENDNPLNRYNKLDYSILVKNKPKLLVEAKSLGTNLFEKYSQLEEYFLSILNRYEYSQGELIGILTDGDTYLFYSNFSLKDSMDKNPFYYIQLSISEETECIRLLNYSKSNILKSSIIYIDEEYDLKESYRIDVIENVFNYFQSKGIPVKIDKVYFRGRVKYVKNFRSLYKELLSIINNLNPNMLYNLAYTEDLESNGRLINRKFSLNHINSSEIEFKTNKGIIYLTLPNTRNGIIDRIIYLVKKSNFGIQNILITLKRN